MSIPAQARFSNDLPFTNGGTLVSVANPNRDGSGTLATLVAPGQSQLGARVSWVRISALAATTAGMIRLFVGSPGAGYFLLDEIPVSAVTPGANVPSFSASWFPPFNFASQQAELALKSAGGLYASTENAESFAVIPFGATL